MCAASERQRGWAIRRGNWGLRRQFLEEQDAWACSTSRKHEWKDLCVCELEKMLEVRSNMEEYFRLRKQHTQFSLLFTIFKMWFFLQRELTSQMLQQVYLCVEVITIYNKTNVVIAFITSCPFSIFILSIIWLKMHFILFSYEGTHWIAKIIENIPNARITLTPPIELGDISKFEELKTYCETRVIPTHLSYSMLPMNIKQKQCKVSSMVKDRGSGVHKTELGFLLCCFQAVWPLKTADVLWVLVSSFNRRIIVFMSRSVMNIK